MTVSLAGLTPVQRACLPAHRDTTYGTAVPNRYKAALDCTVRQGDAIASTGVQSDMQQVEDTQEAREAMATLHPACK